jgi:hypothetical protein
MYVLCLFEVVYISHVLSLEKKGLECRANADAQHLLKPLLWGEIVL